ncbi:MAG: bifunctional helix-turn-helix transcriptional regulator/GNAT family N-acetyltransferase, partial [Acidimicrobiia bacterium]
FWTTKIGVLQAGLLDTPFSLTEARVIFELAQEESTELADLRRLLGLDAGYVSRLVAGLRDDGLVETTTSAEDARRVVLRLTKKGQEAFGDLDRRSVEQVTAMLDERGEEQQRRLVAAMDTIQHVFSPAPVPGPYVIRSLLPGDLGWVVHRHGALYAEEYGWDQDFEALVARIVADYVDNHDPRRDNAWIAEIDGEPVGCVFCVHRDEETAQLRILLVEPNARGLGIGARLVTECIRFARRAGYSKMMLWTNDVLISARRIYEGAGFVLTHEAPHHNFGHDLTEQVWELDLARVEG